MKVNIGGYKNWTGPYQIANALCWWVPETPDEYGCESKPEWVHNFGTWLAQDSKGNDSALMKLCNWIQSKRQRKINVRIDAYDTWSMDASLALVALPMLKQLRATKHGSPHVDDADVPVPIRSTAPGARDRCEEAHDLDEHHFLRWDWILNEMIWAFEQKVDDNAVDQFYDHGTSVPGENVMDAVKRIKVDSEGLKAWQARKTNGFRLFGKYYENLWD